MKLNINFSIDSDAFNKVIALNKRISSVCSNEIQFSDSMRPHVTLVMGEIEDKNLPQVFEVFENFKPKSVGKSFPVTKPYKKNSWGFIDLTDIDLIKDDCENLIKQLGDLIIPNRYLISNGTTVPHITLFYTNDQINLDSLLSIVDIEKVKLTDLRISLAGKHGTVVKDLQKEEKDGYNTIL